MADQRHLLVLRKGINVWNQWREKHPEILPDLRDGDLHEQSLSGIDFRRTNLDGANLHNAHLSSANLALATLAVQSREKGVVVLSSSSLASAWVEKEVELVRQREGNGKQEVILPIRLDSAVLSSTVTWAVAIRKRRNIRSFQDWQQPSTYQKLLKNLLNDLRKA